MPLNWLERYSFIQFFVAPVALRAEELNDSFCPLSLSHTHSKWGTPWPAGALGAMKNASTVSY